MNKLKLTVILFVFLWSNAIGQSIRYKATINEAWHFMKGNAINAEKPEFDDKTWPIVNLPHTWNAEDAFDDVRGYYAGPGWYRRNLTIPIESAKKRFYLYFEGANQIAEVFVNGKQAGKHNGGYTAFCYDITNLLNPTGINSLAVRVDNSIGRDIAPISADFTFYGGIYRDVYLVATNEIHFNLVNHGSPGIFISTPEVSEKAATISIKAEIKNDALKATGKMQLKTIVLAPDGQKVAEKISPLKLDAGQLKTLEQLINLTGNLELWSPDKPNLYSVECSLVSDKGLVLDESVEPLGLRWFGFGPDNRFLLNGKPLKLNGVCRHQDRAGLGNALDNDMQRQDMELAKNMGANFIRIAHYPQDPAVLDACDKLGLLVWEEIPIVNETGLSVMFTQTSLAQMRDMVRQNFNHPSIIFWGYMNEVFLYKPIEPDKALKIANTVTLAKKLDSLAHAEDPNRLTVMALHYGALYNETGIADIPNVIGWNLYHGWYHDKFDDFGKYLDKEHQKYPNRKLIISEYGGGNDTRLHSEAPEQYDFTMEYDEDLHQSYLRQMDERPWVAGSTLWNLVDFGSEGRKESMAHINNKGMVTMDRKPKDVFWFYKAAFSKEPVIKIASTNWLTRKIKTSGSENTGTQKLRIFTNLPKFELFNNHVSQGWFNTSNFRAEVDFKFVNGKNFIEAKGEPDAKTGIGPGDHLDVTAIIEPLNFLDTKRPFSDLAINVGGQVTYIDPKTNIVWEPDRAYSPGSYGYIGGKTWKAKQKRIATTEDILGTDADPLYQTRLDSLQAYKFDLPDGNYELTLLFAETDPNKKTVLYDLGGSKAENAKQSERVFSVFANDAPILEHLNLASEYGYNQSVMKRFAVKVSNGKGINVTFKPEKDNPILNGIRVRRL